MNTRSSNGTPNKTVTDNDVSTTMPTLRRTATPEISLETKRTTVSDRRSPRKKATTTNTTDVDDIAADPVADPRPNDAQSNVIPSMQTPPGQKQSLSRDDHSKKQLVVDKPSAVHAVSPTKNLTQHRNGVFKSVEKTVTKSNESSRGIETTPTVPNALHVSIEKPREGRSPATVRFENTSMDNLHAGGTSQPKDQGNTLNSVDVVKVSCWSRLRVLPITRLSSVFLFALASAIPYGSATAADMAYPATRK